MDMMLSKPISFSSSYIFDVPNMRVFTQDSGFSKPSFWAISTKVSAKRAKYAGPAPTMAVKASKCSSFISITEPRLEADDLLGIYATNPENKNSIIVSLDKDSFKNSGVNKSLLPVKNIRKISKKDMILNDYCPKIEVNPETYEVLADGELITCEPAETLPLAQRYFMY